jgi:hypothetical protein
LNKDHSLLLEQAQVCISRATKHIAQAHGFVTVRGVISKLGWNSQRVEQALVPFLSILAIFVKELVLQEGMAWVDNQAPEKQFWFPSLFSADFQRVS